MRSFVMKLNLQRSQQAEMITRRLQQAGWRSNDALVRYLFFKATMPIIMGIVAVIAAPCAECDLVRPPELP